jgi:hypothetical protein
MTLSGAVCGVGDPFQLIYLMYNPYRNICKSIEIDDSCNL